MTRSVGNQPPKSAQAKAILTGLSSACNKPARNGRAEFVIFWSDKVRYGRMRYALPSRAFHRRRVEARFLL
jgi:hypothetical protein